MAWPIAFLAYEQINFLQYNVSGLNAGLPCLAATITTLGTDSKSIPEGRLLIPSDAFLSADLIAGATVLVSSRKSSRTGNARSAIISKEPYGRSLMRSGKEELHIMSISLAAKSKLPQMLVICHSVCALKVNVRELLTRLPAQVALSSSEKEGGNEPTHFSSPLVKDTAIWQQPVNLWVNLSKEGLAPATKDVETYGDGQGLDKAFGQLEIKSRETTETLRHDEAIASAYEQQAGSLRPGTDETSAESTSKDNPESASALVPGEFFLPAFVWPGKIGKGCAALAGGLLSSLGGQSTLGRTILIYKVFFWMCTIL